MTPELHDIPPTRITHGGQLGDAMDCIKRAVVDGLRHGFFECSITCEIGKGGRRNLIVQAGNLHKFTIPEEELPALK